MSLTLEFSRNLSLTPYTHPLQDGFWYAKDHTFCVEYVEVNTLRAVEGGDTFSLSVFFHPDPSWV